MFPQNIRRLAQTKYFYNIYFPAHSVDMKVSIIFCVYSRTWSELFPTSVANTVWNTFHMVVPLNIERGTSTSYEESCLEQEINKRAWFSCCALFMSIRANRILSWG